MPFSVEPKLIDTGQSWQVFEHYQQLFASQLSLTSMSFWYDMTPTMLVKMTPDNARDERVECTGLASLLGESNIILCPARLVPETLRASQPFCIVARYQVDNHQGVLVGGLAEDDSVSDFEELVFTGLVDIFRSQIAQRFSYQTHILTGLQQEISRSESMAMLGEMVGAVTHEINNPLGVAVTGVSHLKEEIRLLVRSFESGELTEDSFQEFVDECTDVCQLLEFNLSRAVSLVQDFKKTAVDQSAFKLVMFDVTKNINSLLGSLAPEIKRHGIKLTVNLPEQVQTNGYPGALSQIVTNLTFNSIRHAFEGVDNPEINLVGCLDNEANEFILYFEDNGTGIPEDIRTSIFEPYFTTKAESGGSGLGMSIARDLAEKKLAGSILLDESFTTGTRFILKLPAH